MHEILHVGMSEPVTQVFKYLRIPTCSHFVFCFTQQTPTKTFEPNNPCSINLHKLLQLGLTLT